MHHSFRISFNQIGALCKIGNDGTGRKCGDTDIQFTHFLHQAFRKTKDTKFRGTVGAGACAARFTSGGGDIDNITGPKSDSTITLISLAGVKKARIRNCWPLVQPIKFIQIKGASTAGIELLNNSIRKTAIEISPEVLKEQVSF